MAYYVFIHRPGPNWLPDTPILEQPLEGHFAYMTDLEARGALVLGGGFPDGAGAMGILRAGDLDEAVGLVEADPAVVDEVVVGEVHPYLVTVGSIGRDG